VSNFIQGQNREQLTLFPVTLDSAVSADNEVRQIDAFVNSLDMRRMGFTHAQAATEGRPAYNPADLLKLYIYGYLNRTRSSRELEKETKRNIEVMWLLRGLQPDHNTIANFRRDNGAAIREVFRSTVAIAQHHSLIGGKILAGDSVKLRAQNSKKNNFNAAKVARHVAYIDGKLAEYNQQLAQADCDSDRQQAARQVQRHTQQRQKYERVSRQLEESGEPQVSTSDPDSRQLIVRSNITEVAYSIQTINDAKHNLILDYETTQRNDAHALSGMVRRAAGILGHTNFVALYDKGYHTASEIAACHALGVETLVAVPNRPVSSQAPDPAFNYEAFTYNPQSDTYTCPAGQELRTNGTTYTSKASPFKQYTTSHCKQCHLKGRCTAAKTNGRVIQRSEHVGSAERNRLAMEANPDLYRRRQAIVEHPFGTIKRQWGYDHTLMKRFKERVAADIGLILTCYNLRRLLSILSPNGAGGFFARVFAKIRLARNLFRAKFSLILKTVYQKWASANSLKTQLSICYN